MNRPVIVIGAGGHATVVADALLASGADLLGFTDSDPALHGRLRCGHPILGGDDVLDAYAPERIVLANGIGGVRANTDSSLRVRMQLGLEAKGWQFVTVRHPSAVVSAFAHLGDSCQILAGAVVQANASLGKASIVNTGAIIEHDVHLGDWVHVAPRAVVCGDASIGAGTHVGAGSVIRHGVSLGADVLVGAGAAVVKDQAAPAVLAGVPARVLDQKT
jgi:sugar O-acyltransferase (sialic acid O-acetyltransferase NeuD family)